MSLFPTVEALNSSWTKYDVVKVIEVTIDGKIQEYYNNHSGIDMPILRSYLGIESFQENLPNYWAELYKYPEQVGLFALVADIFTHYNNISWFADSFSKGNMQGVLIMKPNDKHFTNLRSALVVSGAAEKVFRRKQEVPYDLSKLFESGEVGLLIKQLLQNRLERMGYSYEEVKHNFLLISLEWNFHKVLSLSTDQFADWTEGKAISNSLYELEVNGITYEKYGILKGLKIKQWLSEWDIISKFGLKNRRKPEPYFYQFNIPALLLKRIYDIHARRAFTDRKDEPYSQRKHSEQRSSEIKEYIKGGFPWSTISEAQRESESYRSLQMPGWLPTSIIANILNENSERKQKKIDRDSVITIEHIDDYFVNIILPKKIWSPDWTPSVSPLEIIDGQHRVKAFDKIKKINGDYEFPVVAFNDLDFTWQAYLFYTINIKPKRINTSLAYDLMPLLRVQDWLEQDLSGPDIYKKVRAQELTELLWRSNISPWHDRINMLGDTGINKGGPISQNAFINSLITSFVKKWDGKLGGLFGGEMHEGEEDIIQWDKETQTAYLILIWKSINHAIGKSKAEWVIDLKSREDKDQFRNNELQIPFIHPLSFFTTDQGVRPVLYIFNDMSFVANDFLGLNKFYVDIDYEKFSTEIVIELIYESFTQNESIHSFINLIATEIVNKFDWRTPSSFDPKDANQDQKRMHQNQFRGSGGYKEMRMQLIKILMTSDSTVSNGFESKKLADFAIDVESKLGR